MYRPVNIDSYHWKVVRKDPEVLHCPHVCNPNKKNNTEPFEFWDSRTKTVFIIPTEQLEQLLNCRWRQTYATQTLHKLMTYFLLQKDQQHSVEITIYTCIWQLPI